MALRVCSQAGCPELVAKGKCSTHAAQHEQARGTRQARGYDAAHDRLRAQWARKVATGMVNCWRCSKRISVLVVWHLGHCDDDRTMYHGPEHEACSTATTARGRCAHVSHM